ncbi:MAG: hypothetical protein JXA54_01815, partial [Candidatus Heimdallarchaeota archaeon]|nr:hypothetical protein [Candidatus Heimdallarchaeota archaeon]
MGKKKLIGIIVTTIIIGNFILLPLFTIDIKGITPFFSLKIAAIKGGVRPDYCNLMKQQLAQIGIGIDFIFYNWMTWSYFYWYLQSTCDMFYVGLSGGGADPDFTGVYDENGSL